MKDLYKYIWKVSGRQQVLLSVLAASLFLVQLAPLELQRRIINDATARADFHLIAWLCAAYVMVVLVQGGLKLAINVYRGSVTEAANQRLRLEVKSAANPDEGEGPCSGQEGGVAISIIVSEVEVVGGFIGSSFSEPVLNAGILLSVLGYMLYTQPMLALVAVGLFVPQFVFIPMLQKAINERTESRIKTMRAMSVDMVNEAGATGGRPEEKTFRRRVADVYRLNMEIFYRKYGMSFLMNLLQHLGTIGILAFGSWLLLQGKTEMGTIVAFISGVNRMNDPWSDLVNFFRDMTNAAVRYQLILGAMGAKPAETGEGEI
jgi:ABC-type bacteriocin/lantibiotic exporter with double-glycine peptidase domain